MNFCLVPIFLAAAQASTLRGGAPVFNYAKYANQKDSESVDFAEAEDEDFPLIFSQAKFEDSGIDLAEEDYDFDLAEEEAKPVFDYAKYAIKKNSESVDFAEEEEEDYPVFDYAKYAIKKNS